MATDASFQEELEASFVSLIAEGRGKLGEIRPELLAANCGIYYHEGQQEYELEMLGAKYSVRHPEYILRQQATGEEAPFQLQALAIHYFTTADGTPLRGKWITLREVPGALHYAPVFQGYTGDSLARAFGNDLPRFVAAARALDGVRHDFGDASFAFRALPRVPMLIVYWLGDEEFSPTARVLFDESVPHYLPAGALPVVGARLCGMFRRAGQGKGRGG